MKTRRQYIAYVRQQEAMGVPNTFIMSERAFRGAETPQEEYDRLGQRLEEINNRMLPLILADASDKDPQSDLFHLSRNAANIVKRRMELDAKHLRP